MLEDKARHDQNYEGNLVQHKRRNRPEFLFFLNHRQFFKVGILGRWNSLSLKGVANLEPLQEQLERISKLIDPRQLRSRIRTGARHRH
jgi:hypothetical protein